MNNLEFANPYFLWLLGLVPLLAVWFFFTRKKESAQLKISSVKGFSDNSFLPKLKPLLNVLRLLALTLLIVALARPRNVETSTKIKSNEGIDIMMAIDVSSSMLSRDLKPNRLEALKEVASDFVSHRPHDRIGIVLYASESYTQVPLTSDKDLIKKSIATINWGKIEDGTAIGMGLGTAVNRLKNKKDKNGKEVKSKVIILLSDGVNNSGFVDPKTSTQLAKDLGIKVYSIGLGTNGLAETLYGINPYTGENIFRKMKVEIDEKLLKFIAKETGGKYFRATNKKKLKAIYDEIDKLEKTEIEEFKYYNYTEQYRFLVLLAGLFLLLEFVLRNTIFKSFI